jgi:ferrous iron transport protein B
VTAIALIGNPNSGKSSLFNLLAGTRQKVGNYPGVTVDVKSAKIKLENGESVALLDMPGLYSMYPTGREERLVVDALLGAGKGKCPDGIIYTVDASLIESQLLLFTQLLDLGFPLLLVVNMIDELEKRDLSIDIDELRSRLGVPVLAVSSRTGENIDRLKHAINELVELEQTKTKPFYRLPSDQVNNLRYVFYDTEVGSEYFRLLQMHHAERQEKLSESQHTRLTELKEHDTFQLLPAQVDETMDRAEKIKRLLAFAIVRGKGKRFDSNWFDRVLTHNYAGPVIFTLIMLFTFQAIFAWATYPMDLIEGSFAWLSMEMTAILPPGWFSSLITDGLLAGLSGVMVFIPQIAILFFLITILEEVGYMARAVYLFDRLLQRVGMNGRSVVALISGGACAIPAIMSARTIENWKERLITIMVTPFISCSARIPVFALLIAFVVPYERVWWIFNSQGLAFAGLYVLGVAAAMTSAYVFKRILRSRDASFLMMELPTYRWPDWTNVWVQVRTKVGSFVTEAGKIIVMISLILWGLASYGPKAKMSAAEIDARTEATELGLSENEANDLLASKKLEASFAGHIGKVIEPVIRPLGYDWKIGIALITSFAAREIFVGSMATIYSVGSQDNTLRIRDQMAKVTDPQTGKPVFTQASALSLILFFLLAMQCMSTLAIVYKETGTWKWPIIQFTFMTTLAYLVSWATYQLMS